MKRVFETVAIVVALGACQASPPSAGPSVSGESHFLSACAATSECVAGLECLCGRCTLACADDADCEAVESGAVCPDEMTCGAGGRTCTREVTDAGFQEPCVAPADGECPADAADAFRGTRLDLERQCRIRGDEIVSCRRETLEQGVLLCRRRVSDGAEFFMTAGTCLPGEWTECAGGPSFTGEDWPTCPGQGVPDCVAPVEGACPADVAVAFPGARLDRERQCRAPEELISCLYDPQSQPVSGCRRRVSDGAEFFINSGVCLPGEWTECAGEPFTAEDWPECPGQGTPDCVAPVEGACPADVAEAFSGVPLDRERQCRAAEQEVVSCLYNAGRLTAFGCRRRVSDGAEFAFPEIPCLPGEWTVCVEDEFFTANGWPVCPADVLPGLCQPRDLGLTVTPLPAADTSGAVQSVSVRPDGLEVVVIGDGGAEATFTFTGPFGTLDPAALEGLNRLDIVVRDGGPGDFMATLRGCDRPRLVLLNGTRGLLERMFGLVDELFDTDVACDPDLAAGTCPRNYRLWWEGQSIAPGAQVSGLTAEYRAGQVEGCAGDPAAAARVELAALPRADIPTCAGAGEPGNTDPAFTLRDDAGAIYQPVDDSPVEVTVEVAASPDPADPTRLALAPLTPTAAFGTLHLQAPVGMPTALVPPVTLHLFAHVPWHVNSVIELSDATGLRFAGASSDLGGLTRFSHLQAARQAPACLLPWDSGVIAFSPLTLQRAEDAVVEAPLGVTAPEGAGVQVDVHAAGEYLEVCVSDSPGGWVSFAATWAFDCAGLEGQPCAAQWEACCPRDEARAVCLPDPEGQLEWQRPPEGVICTCAVAASPQTTATCEAL
jgi:hypothetical protein